MFCVEIDEIIKEVKLIFALFYLPFYKIIWHDNRAKHVII